MKNLKDLMISISEFKVQMSEIIKNKVTKVIVKNNEPVAVIMPYAEYIERAKDSERIEQIGQDITLQNGVQMMVTVSKEKDDSLCIKTYVKMKTTGDYKLHFTHHIGMPTIESTMTTKEIIEFYERNDN
ncbi:type II toxin-antitoxin system prevent-host-death family antitoxin [Clostridium butyricum]|jgi:prevent-host-death family protein|uniref:type II toxin-antitoxin system prevent-host-death family antitoxin n=1 Tax=Clostridium butyricum TaxID=1492 RepID=UPI002048192D|nr:type II toxin-antitoxin system prevent-host-death family antitoxin [Clostridium butyricum]MDB2162432.1 type II toxin-antitoxin system prevent-host-death family antitoxin [Clostridium butyricum]DAQ97580.1 MAG TPA: Prevent host death protein Host Death, PHD, intrinsic [Caudoviricetes sp.]